MAIKNTGNFLPLKNFEEKNGGIVSKLNNSITFTPVIFDPESGQFGNVHLLYQMLPVLEDYSDIFDDASVSPLNDYDTWLDLVLDFIKAVTPWFYLILVDGQPRGAMWVSAWESFGNTHHAVEIGGLAARKVNPLISMLTLYRFTEKVFTETDVNIIRAEFAKDNHAVRRCLLRVGYSHPEPRRCLKIRHGKEISGCYLSVTRPEWEALHEQEEEEQK